MPPSASTRGCSGIGRGWPARWERGSERTCRASCERGRQLLDALRGPADPRLVQPAPPPLAVRVQESHPPVRGRLHDDVGLRLASLPRPVLAVEADRVAAIVREADHPREGPHRASPAALEVAYDAVHGPPGVKRLAGTGRPQ